MKQVSAIGLDLGKHVFQVRGADAEGSPVLNRKLRRSEVLRFFEKLPPRLVGMEACGSAHYRGARSQLSLMRCGSFRRLMSSRSSSEVKRMRRTQMPSAIAVPRKTMRFAPIKTAEQQAAAIVLKTRALLVRQRTQAVDALRVHLAELGIIATAGLAKIKALAAIVRDETDARLPAAARSTLVAIADEIEASANQIGRLERAIVVEAKRDEDMRRLITIPGVSAITAATIKVLVPDPGGFKSARHFAAWLGLRPRCHSSGGKERLGRVSKMGNPELRALLVVGANSRLAGHPKPRSGAAVAEGAPRQTALQGCSGRAANKTARIIWALLNKGGTYRRPAPPAITAVAV
ncbi:IS110 family RNA-guided transposase [Bradyrhizobium sp. USDA 4529]